MEIVEKMFKIFLGIIFPKDYIGSVLDRLEKTKKAINSTVEVRCLFRFISIFFNLVIGLIVAIVKILIIWIPGNFYNSLKYSLSQLEKDLCVKHLGVKVSVNRFFLCMNLLIKGKQKKKSFGKLNPDKTFFVIRPYYYMNANDLMPFVSNLLFHYYRNLQHLSYAVNRDWIPVVDWRNYGPFPHQEEMPINGTTDCWEYYWKQPSEYTLEEVYQSKNVILSTQNSHDYGLIPPPQFYSPYARYIKLLATECPKYAKLFQFNDYTMEYMTAAYNRLFPENARVLGICVRSMSYGTKKIANHPIQPTFEELTSLIDEKLEEWNLDYCFVTCESQPTIDDLKSIYGDKLFYLERLRYTDQPTDENNILYEDGRKYQTNLDYLTEMYLLSKCTCFLGGMSSGTRAAIIWNGNEYENVFVFDKNNWI